MFNTTIANIKRALNALGVKGKFNAHQTGDIVKVTVNGEHFGLWDAVKNTFVE